WPWLISSSAPAGVSATRYSSGLISLATPICMAGGSLQPPAETPLAEETAPAPERVFELRRGERADDAVGGCVLVQHEAEELTCRRVHDDAARQDHHADHDEQKTDKRRARDRRKPDHDRDDRRERDDGEQRADGGRTDDPLAPALAHDRDRALRSFERRSALDRQHRDDEERGERPGRADDPARDDVDEDTAADALERLQEEADHGRDDCPPEDRPEPRPGRRPSIGQRPG